MSSPACCYPGASHFTRIPKLLLSPNLSQFEYFYTVECLPVDEEEELYQLWSSVSVHTFHYPACVAPLSLFMHFCYLIYHTEPSFSTGLVFCSFRE